MSTGPQEPEVHNVVMRAHNVVMRHSIVYLVATSWTGHNIVIYVIMLWAGHNVETRAHKVGQKG